MSIPVEFPVLRSFRPVSLLPYHSKRVLRSSFFSFGKKLDCNRRTCIRLRVAMSTEKNYPPNGCEDGSEFVEVIGIGSRKDALLDFCFESPLRSSSSLRFWNIIMNDAGNVQLQQRFLGKDSTPRIVEASLFLHPCSKAIILVASAGYGPDDIAAIEILRTIKSMKGFAIAIILKPFSFEGQRRLDEVKDLVAKLRDHTNFCIDIETDRLLEKDMVTLDEALRSANNAVLLAINAISVLTSDMHRKLFDIQNNLTELKVSEVLKIIGSYKEAKVGFGSGSHIKASILQAIYDCPFIGTGLKEFNGVIICIVASSNVIDDNDLQSFLHTFHQTMEYSKEIIISSVHEPNLESDLLVTTVVTVGSLEQQASQKRSILSRLAHHFPFVFNLLGRSLPQSNDTGGNNAAEITGLPKLISPPDSNEMENRLSDEEGSNNYSEEVQRELNNYNNIYSLSGSGQSEAELYESRTEPSNFYHQFTEGNPSLQREPLNSWNLGPGYQIAQEWAKERAADSVAASTFDNLSIFCIPVGVRPTEDLKDSGSILSISQTQEPKMGDDVKSLPANSGMSSLGALTGASFEVVKDFYSTASTLLKGRTADGRKKQGGLSMRAASMLEAERDSPKKWTPVLEMQYRGGVYRGRCQGGLPEGKGRLILQDGSIYDGMWRYGKRSGPGTFYFSNGDVFQGSWRDDVMHGKGWFYFHSGDRWFANFWKGKANGEGRFYSKSGQIFFGHFEDGWRHGHFLCIDADGERCIEIWDEGVLVSRKQLESDTSTE